MTALTSKDGDSFCHCDTIDKPQAQKNNTFLKYILVSNHDVAANKGRIKGQLRWEHIFDFEEHLKNY